MPRLLIVNADDLGMSHSRNAGIFAAITGGAVRSVSVIVNLSEGALEDATSWLRSMGAGELSVSVGVHGNISEGAPVRDDHVTLTGEDGRFFGKAETRRRLLADEIDPEEIQRELEAQLDRLAGLGFAPTHVDGHQHVHVHGAATSAFAKAASSRGVPWIRVPAEPDDARVDPEDPTDGLGQDVGAITERARRAALVFTGAGLRVADGFIGLSLVDRLTTETLRDVLGRGIVGDGVTELMCHPGYRDPLGTPFCSERREVEMHALTAPDLQPLLDELGITLTNFAAVDGAPA